MVLTQVVLTQLGDSVNYKEFGCLWGFLSLDEIPALT